MARTLVVLGVATILVVAIALLAGLLSNDPNDTGDATDILQGPLVSTVTGTTDRLTPGEISTAPTVAPAPGRVQPSQEEWLALLPRLQEIVDANPDDINARRKLALAHYNLGQFEEAVTLYEQLLAIEEDAVLRNRLGNTLRDMGSVAEAEAAYRTAITDDPTLAPPYLNLAELLWRQGRDREALAIIEQGLGAVPEEHCGILEEGRETLQRLGR